jgi:hypothetical protein
VKDALTIRNGLNIKITLDLPLQSNMRVWREKEGWKGLYKLIVIDEETYTVDILRGPVKFRLTVVKLYLTE